MESFAMKFANYNHLGKFVECDLLNARLSARLKWLWNTYL